jgi:peptidoglycan/LPS O-acetylase OafA/YrhL
VASEQGTGGERHYAVLDALRFVMALWVAIGHFEVFPLFSGVDVNTRLGHFLTHAWSTVVFGTPAVIVFFVISGFCIHLPFRGDKKLEVGRYYLRRYTRILIPVAGALCIYRLWGQKLVFWGENSILFNSPLWSLACEEIYYAAYPLLRMLRKFAGWKVVLPAAFAAGVGVAATHFHAKRWLDFGPLGTSIILLPVWLLGCVLAEQSNTLPKLESSRQIWMWRAGMWLASWVTEMLHFKGGVPFTQSMIWFGVLAYFWVKKEIEYSGHRAPNRYLVMAGAWSYSLYLVHQQGMELIWRLGLPNLGVITNWFLTVMLGLAGAYVFYVAVERPSHRLARKIKLTPRAAKAASSLELSVSGSEQGEMRRI